MRKWIQHKTRAFSLYLIVILVITMMPQMNSPMVVNAQSVETSLDTMQPYATVKESYDQYLSLTLGVRGDVDLESSENLYYAVEVKTNKNNLEEIEAQKYFFKKEASQSQDVMIQMNQGTIKAGEKWTYDIQVSLVWKTNNEIEQSVTNISEVELLRDVEVIPFYENKLSLIEGVKKIYTTQSDVPIATLQFSTKTTEKDLVKIEDLTYATEENKQYALHFKELGSDLKIYASASANTALGTHRIRVTACAPENMYASEAFITVNVVQGIEEGMLSVITPSNQLCKAVGKTATLTFKAQFTSDFNTGISPSRKVVVWDVLSSDGKAFTQEDPLYGMIGIKNGILTVKKNYIVSDDKPNNQFMVKATAADYNGNVVSSSSELVDLVSQSEKLGEVAIVKMDLSGNAVVTARSNTSITSDQLGYIRVFRTDAPIQESYSLEELQKWTFVPKYLSYQASDGAIRIDQNGMITALKTARNVKINVRTKDQSGNYTTLNKLTIVYSKPAHLGLKIEMMMTDGTKKEIGEILSSNTTLSNETNANACYLLTLMERADVNEEWKEIESYVNHSLNVSNGTIIKVNGTSKQCYLVNTSKEILTIRLFDKANQLEYRYTLQNQTFPSGKIPLIVTSNTLKAVAYKSEQMITYNLKKNGDFAYDSVGKVALLTLDYADKYKSDRNLARYNAFEKVLGGTSYYPIENGKVVLTFLSDTSKPLPAGDYKLWFTFGTLDDEGRFRADTASKAVWLKAQKVQVVKGSFSPNSSYKMAIKEGGSATLSGVGTRYIKDTLVYSNIRNANVNGLPNAFRTYFELDGNKLRVKEDLTQEQLDYINATTASSDCSGYIDYKVAVRKSDGSYVDQIGTFKVKVTLTNSIRKFSLSSAKVKDASQTTDIKAYADGKVVNIIHAVATSGRYEVACDGTSKLTLVPKTGDDKPKVGNNYVTVYIVPDNTYEANKETLDALKLTLDSANGETKESAKAAYSEAMKKYGIKVTAKVVFQGIVIQNRESSERVVELVNQERIAAGLQPLSVSEELMSVAFVRARETTIHFDHTRPDGRSCFTILGENNIAYRAAGENIAYGYSNSESVMAGWMGSPGHRSNILNSNFTHMGVGCYISGGRLYWVQVFIGTR